jgi:predicted nucleic acid-binding protein
VIVFLDTAIVIYLVENPPTWGTKATNRITALKAAGETFAVTEPVRMECLVGPYKTGNVARLADFAAFFAASDVQLLPISTAVAQRAAQIRARHNFDPLDSLHLAAAVEHGCGLFLTNDAGLKTFPDLAVEILS